MRLSLDALQVLDAIARQGSFAAAAEALHRVPSAVTYTVRKLEQDLDIALFDRSGHRAVMTPAGRELLEEGRRLLRAAAELEARAVRVATGWEAELRIAVGDLVAMDGVWPLVAAFYAAVNAGTRLRLACEVYGGAWDALLDGRADLVIGAPAEGPAGGGYGTRVLGSLEFVFVVAPDHPLAGAPEPLGADTLRAHRAIAAADSSRSLPARTGGLLSGQDVLTVPDMAAKIEAHRRGLGAGYVPLAMVRDDLAAGRLVALRVEEPSPGPQLLIAWRNAERGRALRWFLQQLEDAAVIRRLLGEPAR